jgi:hypothetical protein
MRITREPRNKSSCVSEGCKTETTNSGSVDWPKRIDNGADHGEKQDGELHAKVCIRKCMLGG